MSYYDPFKERLRSGPAVESDLIWAMREASSLLLAASVALARHGRRAESACLVDLAAGIEAVRAGTDPAVSERLVMIEAAPDLLQALKDILPLTGLAHDADCPSRPGTDRYDPDYCNGCAHDRAKAAICKAEGRS